MHLSIIFLFTFFFTPFIQKLLLYDILILYDDEELLFSSWKKLKEETGETCEYSRYTSQSQSQEAIGYYIIIFFLLLRKKEQFYFVPFDDWLTRRFTRDPAYFNDLRKKQELCKKEKRVLF